MKKTVIQARRTVAEGRVPLVDVEGTAYECGRRLGQTWRELLQHEAARAASNRPCWLTPPYKRIIEKRLPHLPDVYRGMAAGAGLPENQVGVRAPEEKGACTSFAIQPKATLDGRPICGQTKDTGDDRTCRYIVLRMKMTDAPSALTLTYPGWLFGHGFVKGGCAIFRNSLFAGESEGLLPFDLWGLLALHCPTTDAVVEMTRRYGVLVGGHCTVADERGSVVGIEMGAGGIAFCRPRGGLYVHANAAHGKRLAPQEKCGAFTRENSLHRERRVRARLEPDAGRLTPQLAYAALCDHEGYPASVCRHEGAARLTTASAVAEPTRGLLHVSRGSPCQNWPATYQL